MKNKRQISKELTRRKILDNSKTLLASKGLLNTSTKEIADYCEVAHGTLFSHFKSRDVLISEILEEELKRIARELYKFKKEKKGLRFLLSKYFDFLEKEEDFMAMIAKEFPFFNDTLKSETITTESIIKLLFYNQIQEKIARGTVKKIDITMALSFLFGTINYYLGRRELFTAERRVIPAKKEQIIDTFMSFINP